MTDDEGGRESRSSVPDGGDKPKHRWNILWMIVGIFLYIAAMAVGQEMILKFVVEANPELKAAIEEGTAQATDPTESDKERLRSVFFAHRSFIGSLLALVLISGLLVGAIVGFFSDGVLEGAAALGIAAVFGFVVAGQALVALIAGILNAGLGALGAYGGRSFLHRFRRVR